jgi:hypothetical protein
MCYSCIHTVVPSFQGLDLRRMADRRLRQLQHSGALGDQASDEQSVWGKLRRGR